MKKMILKVSDKLTDAIRALLEPNPEAEIVSVEDVPCESEDRNMGEGGNQSPISSIFNSRLKADLIETDLADLLSSKPYITVATEWYVVLQVFAEKGWTKASQDGFVEWVQKKFPHMKPPKDANSLRACRRTDLNGIDLTDNYPNGPYRDLADALKNQFFGKLKENGNYEFEEKYLKFHQNPRTK